MTFPSASMSVSSNGTTLELITEIAGNSCGMVMHWLGGNQVLRES